MASKAKKVTKGRPRIEIDKDILKALSAVMCSNEEICAGLRSAGCELDLRTLKRRLQEPLYREIWQAGRNERKIGLRRLQWRHAQMPNSAGVNMTQHISKHWLGETEAAAVAAVQINNTTHNNSVKITMVLAPAAVGEDRSYRNAPASGRVIDLKPAALIPAD
jgi:hypothetical protein